MGRFTLGLLLLLLSAGVSAQSLVGALEGAVHDAQGGGIPGATVSLSGRAGTVSILTDPSGSYRFPAVEPGTCALRVDMPGFRSQRRDRIAMHAGERLTVDIVLSVGTVGESVDVWRNRPSWTCTAPPSASASPWRQAVLGARWSF